MKVAIQVPGEIKKMFASNFFRTSKIYTGAVLRIWLPTIFDDLGQTTYFIPNRFQKYRIISVHQKWCNSWTRFTKNPKIFLSLL